MDVTKFFPNQSKFVISGHTKNLRFYVSREDRNSIIVYYQPYFFKTLPPCNTFGTNHQLWDFLFGITYTILLKNSFKDKDKTGFHISTHENVNDL
jgi:hypothetical protein